MLRAESLGQFVRLGMGQGGSRTDGIDTAAAADGMSPNGHARRMDAEPRIPSVNTRLDSLLKSPNDLDSKKGSLKRTRDERENEDYEPSDSYRVQLSPDSCKQARNETTNRDSTSLSPTNMRHSFIPERNDDGWTNSSNPAHREGRTDQWMPSLNSPLRGPISPPPRPPLGPRTNSAFTTQPSARPAQISHKRRDSEQPERTRYPNLKWTAPGLQSSPATNGFHARPSAPATIIESPLSPIEDGQDHVDRHSASVRENSNGLEGAPTGPKNDPRAFLASLRAGNRRPYIYISGRSLPPKPSTREHLFKFLRSFITARTDVTLDDKGWTIWFDATQDGLDRLDQCYWAKNHQILFGEYTLELHCHPDGMQDFVDNPSRNKDKLTSPVAVKLAGNGISKQTDATLDDNMASNADALAARNTAVALDARLRKITPRASSLGLEARVVKDAHRFRHSSPLRVPSSLDKDDTSSSISGLTGSDLSTSRLPKCHACKKTPVSELLDLLVKCSSCPRRWHPRCHENPDIPSDLRHEHSWQCRRCVKKNVPPKTRLSRAAFVRAPSSNPSVGQPDEPPAKKPRLEETLAVAISELSNGDVLAASDEFPPQVSDVFDEQQYSPHDEVPPEHEFGTTEPVVSDEVRIPEAEDLVEKSFSTLEDGTNSDQKAKKPLMLNLVRKKLSRNEEDHVTRSIHDENTNPFIGEQEHSIALNDKDADIVLEDTSLMQERHKWKGGGSDKAIIEAGMQSFFSDGSVRRGRDPAAQNKVLDEVVRPIIQDARPEVPESPEEARKTSATNDTRTPTVEDVETSPKIKLKLKNTKSSERLETTSLKPQNGPGQRMKLGGVSSAKCKRCNKTIAYNPAGTKLCSKCKKAAATEGATPSADIPAKDDQRVADDASRVTPGAAEEIELGILDLVKSTPSAKEAEEESSPTKEISESRLGQPEAACTTCRSRHKRCTHRSTYTSSNEYDNREDGPTNDDLDFWTAGPDSPKRMQGGVRDTEHASDQPTRDTANEDRDPSSSLSPAPDATPSFATKIKKRTSFARVATSEFDVGDSHERPNNSYKKLIGMALCAAENHCLSANEIRHWIVDNIAGYRLKEGTWANGISATLSMNRETVEKPGLWRKVGGDEGKKNAPCFYQLVPGQESMMLHWDPVLKQPVSPIKHRSDDSPKTKRKPAEEGSRRDISLKENLHEASESIAQVPKKRLILKTTRTPNRPTKHAPKSFDEPLDPSNAKQNAQKIAETEIDELQMPNVESSDDEPIAMSRKGQFAATNLLDVNAPGNVNINDQAMSLNGINGASVSSTSTQLNHPAKLPYTRDLSLVPVTVDKNLVVQFIKEDAESLDCSAKSLFDEWPEFDPENEFDSAARIAEIKLRPTRKQKFNAIRQDAWAGWKPSRVARNNINIYSSSKSSRFARDLEEDAFVWQANDDVRHYDSLEKMFDLPDDPVPIMQDGQIAYRDGLRNEFDGTLRRAKKIYTTGYAKH